MSDTSNSHSTPAENGRDSVPPRFALIAGVIVVAVLVALGVLGILHRSHSDTVLAERTNEFAPPTVNIATPKMGAPRSEFILPGNVTAYTDSPIYARTDGYLLRWYYDIGARVKKGALLAEIAAPELDQEVRQAESQITSAEATANNAQTQAKRYSDLVKSEAVSQQDTDSFVNQAASTAAAVHSAQANLQRLKELQSFEKIYAPFDGVITGRTVDTGQLINAGAGTQLFHMQALQTLRVYTNVPQVYAPSVKTGMKIPLTFPEHPGKTFMGTLVRTSEAIDPVSRTLLVEVDVDNRSGELFPGSMAQVHFSTASPAQTFIVPAAALLFRSEGLRLGTVSKDDKGNTVARLVPIVMGEDDGSTVQVISGIAANSQIIQDPPDSLLDGQRVTIVRPGSRPGSNGAGTKATDDSEGGN
jgi:RND family efflux transporter MFP subunit